MKYIFFVCLALLYSSCNNENDTTYIKPVQNNLFEYEMTHNSDYLYKAYNELKRANDYKKNGLTLNNHQTVIPLLMYMKKYNELEKLLIKNIALNKFKKDITLNLVKALNVHSNDSIKAKAYITNNLKKIDYKIKENPKDSLLYVDFYIMKTYLIGKEKTLKTIDSLSLEKKFSKDYYEYILKESIKEYPKEFLWN